MESIENLNDAINQKLSEADRLESAAMSISTATKDVNVMESCGGDKLGDIISRVIDMRKAADDLTDCFYDKKCDVERTLRQMENQGYADILYRRYILFKSIYQIATEEKMPYWKMKRLHVRALREFEKTQDIVVDRK